MRRRPAALAAALTALALAPSADAAPAAVRDGGLRVEVVTPTLVRVQTAGPDGRFEQRPTLLTLGGLDAPAPRIRSSVEGPDRVIRTSRIVLRWRRGATSAADADLRVRVDGRTVRPRLGPNPAPLGGWRRSLDLVKGRVPLHEGVLSKAGWAVVDDSASALVTPGGPVARDTAGSATDLYVFAYGQDLTTALRDLRTLTGPAPLLPRKAFGVWFSRWWPYSAADWRDLVARFRAERVPLDTISLDTDFKRVTDPVTSQLNATAVGGAGKPYSWNGWGWNADLYPDPKGFLRWARETGLAVGLNVHPSISESDPAFPGAQERAGGGLRPDDGCRIVQGDATGRCMVFDWSQRPQLDAYFALHEPFEADGTDFWWLDWCCDGSNVSTPGLTPDTWINAQYFDRQRARGSRWPAFQRIGGSFQAGFAGRVGNGALAEHRTTLQFTGDTCGTWELLGFASEFTAAAAAIGMPYVSHDIGTFHAVSPTGLCDPQLSPILTPRENTLPPDMYVRWVQLGAYQPLLRLHSHHGKRLPWEFPGKPGRVAAAFLREREALVPTLYALAREARDTGVPMVRPLWLRYSGREEAFAHPSQYLLGEDLLVAPVTRPGDPATVDVWFPPGTWVDRATGERHRGPGTRRLSVPLERAAVFARAGAVVVTQPDVATTDRATPRRLVLTAYRGAGGTTIYDDAGAGLAYERGQSSATRVVQRRSGGATTLTLGAARGSFPDRPARRTYDIVLVGVDRPRIATVDGRAARVRYDAGARTARLSTGAVPFTRATRVVVR